MTPDRVVVVTGASAGVGRAVAQAFADQGAAVGLLARGVQGLEVTRADLEARGARALALPTDVSDASAVEQAATQVESQLGSIDVWVNVAMVSVFSPVHELTAEEVRRVTDVTYLGSVNGILAAVRRMRPRDRGTIIQVGSALAYRAIPLQASYCGAKFAIRGFVDSLRCELAAEGSNVRVTTVHLPGVNTPSSRGCAPASRAIPVRYRPSTNPRWQPEASCGRSTTTGGRSSWAVRPLLRCWPTSSPPAWSTATSPGPTSKPSRWTSRLRLTGRTTCWRQSTATTKPTASSTTKPTAAASNWRSACVGPGPAR
ncbi:MAG TPA: SDR family oxidoreductase [Acidimicrobiales bacterium]|nr:SDR family oxidoreductase [Acidimicrobiales bacterium]